MILFIFHNVLIWTCHQILILLKNYLTGGIINVDVLWSGLKIVINFDNIWIWLFHYILLSFCRTAFHNWIDLPLNLYFLGVASFWSHIFIIRANRLRLILLFLIFLIIITTTILNLAFITFFNNVFLRLILNKNTTQRNFRCIF